MIIFNKRTTSEPFPVLRLVETVLQECHVKHDDIVEITRIGGPGERIWAIESKIDEGEEVFVFFRDLVSLSTSDGDSIDELRCFYGRLAFGVFDASFMFVQSEDKHVERLIASAFDAPEEHPDIALK